MSTRVLDRAGGDGVDGRSRAGAPSPPARVGPAGRLYELRRMLAASENLDEIVNLIGKVRDLAGKVLNDDTALDDCVRVAVVGERKCGLLLRDGAGAEHYSNWRTGRWRALARMTAGDFAAEIARAQGERRRRAQAIAEPAGRMVTTPWVIDEHGVRTRLRAGIGSDDDPAAVVRQLMRQLGGGAA
jgi:hypothetical protein